ncbi:patatin-like phospholipase family protein [Robbsia sp. KACC 23696]|uniref:patatin-like phospholipase family protein n=1 Tax=Robbsia sp. KACC 23696 TaxID=3149231 RepID=UPI00325B77BC
MRDTDKLLKTPSASSDTPIDASGAPSAAPRDPHFQPSRRAGLRAGAAVMAAGLSASLAACGSIGLGGSGAAKAPPPTAPTAPTGRPLRIGLALGGGAARGFAHIGVIKALEAQGIQADLIAGTSAGSVVGSLYATGMTGLQLNRLALDLDAGSLSDWALPFFGRGFLKGVALQDFVEKAVKGRPIEKMSRPLGIVATDLASGEPILFQRGNTGIAVRASCSVPSVFEPVRIGGRDYVDGGLVSPVPAAFAHKMGADFVIAVDISARPSDQATSSSFDVLMQTFTIMGQSIKAYELDKYANVVIHPELPAMGGSDFQQRNLAILSGEEAVARMLPQLKAKLATARTA